MAGNQSFQKERAALRIFINELRKIWNWRILSLIAAFALLVWFAFLSEALSSYDSLRTHGIYGSYQTEMFERYGDTLEPEELADYDIPGKKAAIVAKLDAIIASEAIFAEHQIHNFSEFQSFPSFDTDNMDEAERNKLSDALSVMQGKLSHASDTQTLDEWYASPLIQMQTLTALEYTYADYESSLRSYIEQDERSVVVRAAEQILHMKNDSLIHYDLSSTFSLYAAIVGVFCTIAVIILVAPLLTTDRMQKVNLLQYSSSIGRKIVGIQLTATIVSSLALSFMLIAAAFTPFLLAGAGDYWNTQIMSFSSYSIVLYNLTFGQYTMALAGMILLLGTSAGCFVFVLARFSTNVMTLLVKTVPAGVGITAIAMLSIHMSFSNNNYMFNSVFKGNVTAPEMIVCSIAAVTGMIISTLVAMREKRTEHLL
jgi:hypothetical protein